MQEVRRGDRVSLVTLKRGFFFQTNGGINLNAANCASAVIPETATDFHLKQINRAVDNGHLVVGEASIKAVMPDRDSDIQKALETGRDKITKWLDTIVLDKSVKQSEKVSVIEKVIDFEKLGKNRTSVIKYCEKRLKYIGGISKVTESDQQKIEIQITTNS